ncbi:MFS transporter [Thermus thermophilus]|uniref:MFS transporter n=1 Tax=Thermus thermophilus TaxID=274 RepID=UPI00116549DE|nr:MFS transporter [Thermus thermophilus]BBL93200.1 MFS transporter [Thermus thermophilus]
MDALARLERLPLGRPHYRLLLLLGFGWALDAMDVGLISFTLPALSRDFGLDPVGAGLLGSVGLLGMLFGALLGGRLADRFGRKAVVGYSLFLAGLGSLLTALAPSLSWVFFFRFLTGLGLGAELPVAASLMGEFSPKAHRGRMVVLLEAFWAVGWLLAALVGYLLVPSLGWRAAFLAGALPALYAAYLRLSLPESPRWLVARGRAAEAEALVASWERAFPGPLPEPRPEPAPRPLPYGALFRPPLLRRTLFLALAWFALNAGYYGAFIWLPSLLVAQGYTLVRSLEYVLLITLAQVPGYLVAAFLVERWGRRPVLVGFLGLSALFAWLLSQAASPGEVLLFGALLAFFNLGAWGAIYAYTPELFPTALRGSGAGFVAAVGRVGGILAPYATGALLPLWGPGGVLALHGGLLLLAGVFAFAVGVETRGKPLEEA